MIFIPLLVSLDIEENTQKLFQTFLDVFYSSIRIILKNLSELKTYNIIIIIIIEIYSHTKI